MLILLNISLMCIYIQAEYICLLYCCLLYNLKTFIIIFKLTVNTVKYNTLVEKQMDIKNV